MCILYLHHIRLGLATFQEENSNLYLMATILNGINPRLSSDLMALSLGELHEFRGQPFSFSHILFFSVGLMKESLNKNPPPQLILIELNSLPFHIQASA